MQRARRPQVGLGESSEEENIARGPEPDKNRPEKQAGPRRLGGLEGHSKDSGPRTTGGFQVIRAVF